MRFLSRLFGRHEPPPAALPEGYRLIDPRPSSDLGPWAPQFPAYTSVIGYSDLGHFFLRDDAGGDCIVLHPFKGAAKSYGVHADASAFERAVLMEPGFAEYVLMPAHVRSIAARLGPLGENEVYIPQPYPFLGGGMEPETYDKGDVWVFAHLVAQFSGL